MSYIDWYVPLAIIVIAGTVLVAALLILPLALVRAGLYHKPSLLRRLGKTTGMVIGGAAVLYMIDGLVLLATNVVRR